jgi:23S rRNA (cytosine1962-C5)-methyltransferase
MAATTARTAKPVAARVVLKPRKAQPFFGRHPWVLASAIDRVEPADGRHDEAALDGQPVDLVTPQGAFIARGFYNSHSRIRVRLYSWSGEQPLDAAFLRKRLASAIDLRRAIGYEPSPDADPELRRHSATRLVFSEADGLSGLVVDRYGEFLVLQPTALAMAQRLETLVELLQELLAPRAIILRAERSITALEGMELADGHVWGDLPDEPLVICEHGLKYEVDLRLGQKTGWYLDQRENRRAVAGYLAGRRVLDMFCYTGGFALAAAALGKARQVLGYDVSSRAIRQARRNAERNGLTQVRFDTADGFEILAALASQGERFDAVILDPPKLARGRGTIPQALMAYHRLNRLAVDLLVPGGILVTCSCTGGVSRDDFLLMLSGVAQKTGRDLRFLEQRGAAPDHPVSATCLETEYLHCVICQVG